MLYLAIQVDPAVAPKYHASPAPLRDPVSRRETSNPLSLAYLIEGSDQGSVNAETAPEVRASDEALIQRIVQRDEAALAALYDRYAGMLSSILNRILRDRQAAEEILQDIFFQLWRTASGFDPSRGSLAGWLLVIARHRAISQLRRHNPAAGEELNENSVALPFNFETQMAQQEMLGRVKDALDSLTQEQRAAIEFAYFEGMSHSEIARRTGDPLGTVKTRLRMAVETLRRLLQAPQTRTTGTA